MPARNQHRFLLTEARVWCALAVVVTAVLLFISPDSYLCDIYNRGDSGIFYMSGKAWMNGLVPYDDFADGKGPLLWLIYGIGYQLSPRSYAGVFWLGCLNYVVTLYLVYSLARLFLCGRRWPLLVAVLMLPAYFNVFVHHEIRAEDFEQLPVAASLLVTFALLMSDRVTRRQSVWAGLTLGAGLGATLMIKYNVTLMLILPAVIAARAVVKEGRRVLAEFSVCIIAGVLTLTVPFIIYFWNVGCLDDFVREYGFNTINTTGFDDGLVSPKIMLFRLVDFYNLMGVLPGAVGVLLWAWLSHRLRWVPAMCFAWFLACTLLNGMWRYYYTILAVFAVFGFIALAQHCRPALSRLGLAGLAGFAAVVCVGMRMLTYEDFVACRSLMTQHNAKVTFERYEYAKVFDSVRNPKVIYWHCLGNPELSVRSHGLPACRRWFQQFGCSPRMTAEQDSAVYSRVSDFVMVKVGQSDDMQRLRQLGYRRVPFPTTDYAGVMVIFAKE